MGLVIVWSKIEKKPYKGYILLCYYHIKTFHRKWPLIAVSPEKFDVRQIPKWTPYIYRVWHWGPIFGFRQLQRPENFLLVILIDEKIFGKKMKFFWKFLEKNYPYDRNATLPPVRVLYKVFFQFLNKLCICPKNYCFIG